MQYRCERTTRSGRIKVKFAEGAESYATKGESIEFKHPQITGKDSAVSEGIWKKKKTFATEEEAVSWLKTNLGMETKSKRSR